MYPAFFIAPAMNPRTVWRCQPIETIISESVAPAGRRSIATTCAVLLLSRGAFAASCDLATFGALGAFLRAVVFFVAGAASGATSGVCAAIGVAVAASGTGTSSSGGAASGATCPKP